MIRVIVNNSEEKDTRVDEECRFAFVATLTDNEETEEVIVEINSVGYTSAEEQHQLVHELTKVLRHNADFV